MGSGKPTGSVLKDTIAVSVTIITSVQNRHSRILLRVLSCGRMKEMRREPEVPEARVPVVECLDGHARITSKELAPIHSEKKWHPSECLFYKSEDGCRIGEKCSYAHSQIDEQPGKRSKKNDDKSAVAMLKITRLLGCVFPGYGAAEVFIDLVEKLKHTEANPMCSIHQSRVTSR